MILQEKFISNDFIILEKRRKEKKRECIINHFVIEMHYKWFYFENDIVLWKFTLNFVKKNLSKWHFKDLSIWTFLFFVWFFD